MTKNLWILTEERPKRDVIHNILFKFSKDNKIPCFIDTIRILPILNIIMIFHLPMKLLAFDHDQIK